MRVYGEAFLFINGCMNFLSLLLAARLGRCRFKAGKALISAGLASIYAVAAWVSGKPFLRGAPILLCVCLLMVFMAFGKRGVRLFPLALGAGWLLSGLSDFALKRGVNSWLILLLSGLAVFLICRVSQRLSTASQVTFHLTVCFHGRRVDLPAFRDSGNVLTDKISGLPVIVIPAKEAKPLLPEGTNAGDLSTLPPGWRLIRAKTATGERTLMCFYPDEVTIRQGKKIWRGDAAAAISDFQESRALLPESLFNEYGEEMKNAVL